MSFKNSFFVPVLNITTISPLRSLYTTTTPILYMVRIITLITYYGVRLVRSSRYSLVRIITSLVYLAGTTLAGTTAFAGPTPRPPATTIAYVYGSPPVAPPLGRTTFIFSTTLFATNSARASLSPSGCYSFAITAWGASCFFACISRLVVY